MIIKYLHVKPATLSDAQIASLQNLGKIDLGQATQMAWNLTHAIGGHYPTMRAYLAAICKTIEVYGFDGISDYKLVVPSF